MFVVGLTGGIGSGKTTVANLFADLGAAIVDADVVAREVTKPDQPAFSSIVKHFGENIIKSDGTLDRGQLRQLIFSNAKNRLWLEKLLHPRIRDAMHHAILNLHAPYCIAVIPLLLEVEFYSFIHRILVVDTSEAEQIKRVMARDNMSKQDVENILNTQANRLNRRAKAQDVIINDGVIKDLIPQVNKLHEMYCKMGS